MLARLKMRRRWDDDAAQLGERLESSHVTCTTSRPHTEMTPQVFGLPLSEVIAANRRHKRRRSPQRDGHSDPTELMLSFLHLTSGYRRANRELSSSNSSLSSASETPCETPPLRLPDVAPRTHRRVGVGVNNSVISRKFYII